MSTEPHRGALLGITDLATVFNDTYPCRAKWYNLGIQLRVAVGTLDCFKGQYSDPGDQLREVLRTWLTSSGKPTWRGMIEALNSPVIEEALLAKELQQKYCPSGQPPVDGQLTPLMEAALLTPPLEAAPLTPPPLTPPTPLSACSIGSPQLSPSVGELPPTKQLQGVQAHPLSLAEEIKQFEEKYADLVASVRNAFKRGGGSFEKVRNCLLQLPVSLKQYARLLQSEASRLARASSIDELFFILSPHWDFLNSSLLAHLVQRFGDDQTKKSVDEYLEELRKFRMRTKLSDFIDKWTGTPLPDTQEIVMELEDNWGEQSLEQLEVLRIEVSRKRCLGDYVMSLKGIKASSVDAVFSLPDVVDIPSLELESLREYFQQHQVLRILHNGTCILNLQLQQERVEGVSEGIQYQSRELQPPPQLPQGTGFHHITYSILSYLDDARSLCRAEKVCSDWYQVIAEEMLWKKLIQKNVRSDPVWRGLSERREWGKYLFCHVTPSEVVTHEFYRQLYPNIIRDINNLQLNWKNGHHTLTRIECHSEKVSGVWCLQYDNGKLISGHKDNTIKIWDRKSLSCTTVLRGHTGWVECLQYDDRVIVTGSDDSTIRVWDVNDGSLVNRLDHHSDWVVCLRFNSDTMVTGSEDRTVAVCEMISPMDIILRKVLKGHTGGVNAVDFDEKYIVSGSDDRTIKVWRTSTCNLVHTLRGHRSGVRCLQYRGNHVVSGSHDHTIRVWDIERGACLKILEGHNETVRCIRFDDRRIVSGSYRTIKVWDFQAALDPQSQADTLCLQTLEEHSDWVSSLQIDDFQIVSGSDDDTILICDFLDPAPPGDMQTDQSKDKKVIT